MKIIRQRNSLQIFHLSSLVEQIRHDEDVALIFPVYVYVGDFGKQFGRAATYLYEAATYAIFCLVTTILDFAQIR